MASGVRGDIAGGTIRAQIPRFQERGLDLRHCFPGTVNVSIAPRVFAVVNPQYTFREVRWAADLPPEDFSFSVCRIVLEGVTHGGYVYYPHPETKPRHFQPATVVEVLAPFVEGISPTTPVTLDVNPLEIRVVAAGVSGRM